MSTSENIFENIERFKSWLDRLNLQMRWLVFLYYKECGTFVPGNGLAFASNRHAQ
jgi:hypothetical protein